METSPSIARTPFDGPTAEPEAIQRPDRRFTANLNVAMPSSSVARMRNQISIGAFVLSLSLGLGGCGSDGEIEAFVKLDTEKAAAFEEGGDDCDAKAKSVGEWRKQNTKRYNEMRKALGQKYKDGPPEKYKEQLGKNKKAVTSNLMKCMDNEAFGKMMDETSSS